MIVSFPLLAALLLQTTSTVLAEVTVTTIAGDVEPGHFDGQGESAKFHYPMGIAVDRNGTILVTEKFHNHLRKIDADGVVTTFPRRTWLGRRVFGGLCSGQHAIAGIATDSDGNVYMADWGGDTIQKLNPQGECSTLAGNGIAGFYNGRAGNAQFHSPLNVAVDPAGNVYVTEKFIPRIRKITPDGMVSTYAGSGSLIFDDQPSPRTQYRLPFGLVMNVDGYIYFVDTGRHRIRRVAPDGTIRTFAGTGESGYHNGLANRATFNRPTGIAAAADGTLYVTDTGNHRIRKITLDGNVSTIAGSSDQGQEDTNGSEASFYRPMGIAIDADGNLLVADTGNHAIRKITFSETPETDDYIEHMTDEEYMELYNAAPHLQYKPVPPLPIDYGVDECAICYDVKTKGQKLVSCNLGCGNSFHKKCIRRCQARMKDFGCPLCREVWQGRPIPL